MAEADTPFFKTDAESISAHGGKLSVNFWFIALIAVMMPIKAMIPKAIIATVIPVRSLLLRMVLKASEKTSEIFMQPTKLGNAPDLCGNNKRGHPDYFNIRCGKWPVNNTIRPWTARSLKIKPVGQEVREDPQQHRNKRQSNQCIFKSVGDLQGNCLPRFEIHGLDQPEIIINTDSGHQDSKDGEG